MKYKGEEYFKKENLKLGDVIQINNSFNKDGKYIILSDKDCGTYLRRMCPLTIKDREDFHYIDGGASEGLQLVDEGCFVEVIGNILVDYKFVTAYF